MKTPSSDLFYLIRSMSKEEKRYFRIYSSLHKRKQKSLNFDLFDAIDAQQSYDEAKLKSSFPGSSFGVSKIYLYQSILKALDAYTGDKGEFRKFRQQIRNFEVLYSKELFDQSKKTLKKAEKIAEKAGDPLMKFELQQARFRLWKNQYFRGVKKEALDLENQKLKASSAELAEYMAMEIVTNEFFFNLRSSGLLRTANEIEKDNRPILAHPLLSAETPPSSLPALIQYHYIWGFHYLAIGKIEDSFGHYTVILGILEKNPEKANDQIDFYLSILYNFCIIALNLNDYEAAGEAIRKMDKLQVSFSTQKARVFYYTFVLRLEYYFGTDRLDDARNMLQRVEKDIISISSQLPYMERYALYFNCASGNFALGEYRHSNNWCIRVMNEQDLGNYPEFQLIARMLRLIIAFEMGEMEQLTHQFRGLYRFLYKLENVYELEKLVLKYIRDFDRPRNKSDWKSLFTSFHAKLTELMSDPVTRRPIQYFDFLSWLTSKIEGISFWEVVLRRK